MTEKLKIFYDENCGFCKNLKNLIRKMDKENSITFTPLTNNENELRAVDNNGKEFYNHEVLTATSKILPSVKKFSWMFEGKAGDKTSLLFYSGLKRVRNAHNRVLGRKDCKNC